MKSTMSIIAFLLITISAATPANAQDNPWKQNSSENPWGKSDSIKPTAKSKPAVTPAVKPTVNEELNKEEPSAVETQVNNTVSTNGSEILFRYPTTRVLIDENSAKLDLEMNKHIRHHYKSRTMFWSNFGVTMGSITASLVSGSPVGLLGLLGGLIASGTSSKNVKATLAKFKADNPNADQHILNKYKRKLRSKKAIAGIGGVGAGLGASLAAGVAIIIVAIATF